MWILSSQSSRGNVLYSLLQFANIVTIHFEPFTTSYTTRWYRDIVFKRLVMSCALTATSKESKKKNKSGRTDTAAYKNGGAPWYRSVPGLDHVYERACVLIYVGIYRERPVRACVRFWLYVCVFTCTSLSPVHSVNLHRFYY